MFQQMNQSYYSVHVVPNSPHDSKLKRPRFEHRRHHRNRAQLFEETRQNLIHFGNCRAVKGDIRMQPKITL